MIQLSTVDTLERKIADHMELLRGAELWSPFQALSALTINWVIKERPNRRRVIQIFSVTPEQLISIVLFYKNNTTHSHNSTWAKIATAHIFNNTTILSKSNFNSKSFGTFDVDYYLSSLMDDYSNSVQPLSQQNIFSSIEHLCNISYSSRLPKSMKKKLNCIFTLPRRNCAIRYCATDVIYAAPRQIILEH